MKRHSSEQFSSGEPQQPLQVDSTPESRSSRSKKRRSKTKKASSAEKGNTAFNAVETEVRQNEVRLIWNRGGDVVLEPQAAKNKKSAGEARPDKKRSPTPKAETIADRTPKAAASAETVSKPENQPETPKPNEAQEASPKSTPEAFHALLDELAAGRAADEARRESGGETPASDNSRRPETAAKSTEALFGSPPPLPPEPTSYRHFFWNEHTITSPAEAMAERTMLPTVDQPKPTEPSSGQERSYVETQPVPAAHAQEHGRADYRAAPEHSPAAEASARPEQSAETSAPQPPLEAVPLHNAGALQFPDRMSSTRTAPGEAFANAIPGRAPEAMSTAEGSQEQLDSAELMKLADTIKVDGVPLREMLAARRIDEAGLRAVVQTFLRGGDVRKRLTQEIMTYEKSFERDPVARRQRSGQMRAALAATSAKVAQKSYALTKTSQKATQHAARAFKGAAKQAGHELRGSGLAERWPSLAAIVVIYTLIIILLLT